MKRIACCLFVVVFALFAFSCGEKAPLTCDGVLAAYRGLEGKYEVFHGEDTYEEDCVCYVRITSPQSDGDVFFYFFADEEAATAYKKSIRYDFAASIFSLFLWDPTWIRSEQYGNLVIRYTDDDLLDPFYEYID